MGIIWGIFLTVCKSKLLMSLPSVTVMCCKMWSSLSSMPWRLMASGLLSQPKHLLPCVRFIGQYHVRIRLISLTYLQDCISLPTFPIFLP